ncbi:MAG: hypothetical protein ACC707_09250 [Thiohalomonadales bacterium]
MTKLLAIISLAALTLVTFPAQSATVTFDFVREGTLTNVDDAEGRWQFSGGKVFLRKSHVGHYIRKKRVSFGVHSTVNKSTVETTVIWRWGNGNFTMQGTHYFGTGTEAGGISATSVEFSGLQNATFTGDNTTTTITN